MYLFISAIEGTFWTKKTMEGKNKQPDKTLLFRSEYPKSEIKLKR